MPIDNEPAPVTPRARSPRRLDTALINETKCRELALKLSRDTRAGKFSRVSRATLVAWNSILEAAIRDTVRRQPSVGKTL